MNIHPEYRKGWNDVVEMLIKQFSGIRENFLMPESKWHQEQLQTYNSVIHLISEYKDIQSKLMDQ